VVPEEDIEAIRRLYAAFSRPDQGTSATLEELDADVEMQDYPGMPGARWHHGHRGAVEWALELWKAFGRFQLEALEFIDAGDRLVVPTRTTGIGKSSGTPVELTATAVYTFRDHRVLRLDIYETKQQALNAAGLPNQA
jgi:ketosteroid isomerase-like protein